MLKLGADVKVRDNELRSALHYGCQYVKDPNTFKLIFAKSYENHKEGDSM